MLFWLIFLNIINAILTLNNLNYQDPINFGPYEPSWSHYEVCRGSKPKNATETEVVIFKENNMFYATLNFNFIIKSSIDEAKIWIYSINDGKKKILWSYKIKDPCQHFVLREKIEKNLNGHNCVVEKGIYNRTVNMTEILKKLLGPAFFYGNYSLKSVIAGKSTNIMCMIVNVEIKKSATKSN